MNNSNNRTDTNDSLEQKKKQKAGLNAVRPDDFVENKFKQLAKDAKISQTEMFNHIFWNYIGVKNNGRKQSALNLESEIDLISKDLSSMLEHFKAVSDKAQNTVISLKTNAEQTEKNLTLDIDTHMKKIEELTKRNDELAQSNGAFNEIKMGLAYKVEGLTDDLQRMNNEAKEVATLIVDKNKTIKDIEKQVDTLERANSRLEKEVTRIQENINFRESKIKNLEQSNASLNDTLQTLDALKKAEIASIKSKYDVYIAELESKIKSSEETKEKEKEQMKYNLMTEYEADKKMVLADMKLEMADFKSKYAEAVNELNILKQRKH